MRFLSAANGEAGLQLAHAHIPDLILLDLQLPDMTGDAVLEKLHHDERTHEIAVVILSADATPAQIRRSTTAGACDYLTKPFEVDNLLGIVDARLEKSKVEKSKAGEFH